MFGSIYIITNSVNSKVYIGLTIQTIEDRWQGHCRRAFTKQEADMQIKRAIYKYGKDNFYIKELDKCEVEELDEKEIYYINLYDSYNNGYNSTLGGKTGSKPLKLTLVELLSCIELYKFGFSLRSISREYNVDKATIKHIIELSNSEIRTSRTYKLSLEDRLLIITQSAYLSRKELIDKWKISKSYLSQLLNGKRRI